MIQVIIALLITFYSIVFKLYYYALNLINLDFSKTIDHSSFSETLLFT